MGDANALIGAAEARIGSVLLGKWRIVRLIGVGGMAAVYDAEHRNRSRVAVKILHPRAGLSSAQRLRFQREGYVANRVGHSGVVEVYDDDVDEEGSAFLVMELLSGQTVAGLAKANGGTLSPEDVLDLADRLLDVLAAAHSKGILHRDVKPENLFVTTEGELKVLDFGIARLEEEELSWSRTADGTLLGTPAFSPPEQARGRVSEMDERSDLWAVGATLFTLLSGRYVHDAATPNEQLGLAMTATPPSLGSIVPDLPAALVRLVDRALAYERTDRWPTAIAMQEEVRRLRQAWPTLEAETSRAPLQPNTEASRGSETFDADGSRPLPPSSARSRRRRAILTPTALAMTLTALAVWSRSRAVDADSALASGAPQAVAHTDPLPKQESSDYRPAPAEAAARSELPSWSARQTALTPAVAVIPRRTTRAARSKETVSPADALHAALEHAGAASPQLSSNPFDRRH